MKLNKLTPEEKRVILDKGTGASFAGEYANNKRTGIYVYRQFRTPQNLDADGVITEIICAKCGEHLGHVLVGERLNIPLIKIMGGGYAEVVEINYDTDKTSYKELLDFFFRIHDSTASNQQGNDRGVSYRSTIFYNNEEETE